MTWPRPVNAWFGLLAENLMEVFVVIPYSTSTLQHPGGHEFDKNFAQSKQKLKLRGGLCCFYSTQREFFSKWDRKSSRSHVFIVINYSRYLFQNQKYTVHRRWEYAICKEKRTEYFVISITLVSSLVYRFLSATKYPSFNSSFPG